jgi:hypothetical protein
VSDRIKLPNRRPNEGGEIYWQPEGPMGPTFAFHVAIGHYPGDPARKPLEIFIKPATGSNAVVLADHADIVGEALSLLLQRGDTPAQLRERFKPHSLARTAAGHMAALMDLAALEKKE